MIIKLVFLQVFKERYLKQTGTTTLSWIFLKLFQFYQNISKYVRLRPSVPYRYGPMLLLLWRASPSPVSATMSSSYAVVTNDIYALISAYWGLGCVFYQPGGAQMCCPKLTFSDILASRTYFTTGWNLKSEARETIRKMVDIVVMSLSTWSKLANEKNSWTK